MGNNAPIPPNPTPSSSSTRLVLAMLVIGVVFILLGIFLLFTNTSVSQAQLWGLRILFAAGVGGVAGGLTGALRVQGNVGVLQVAAAGGLAAFVLIFLVTPNGFGGSDSGSVAPTPSPTVTPTSNSSEPGTTFAAPHVAALAKGYNLSHTGQQIVNILRTISQRVRTLPPGSIYDGDDGCAVAGAVAAVKEAFCVTQSEITTTVRASGLQSRA